MNLSDIYGYGQLFGFSGIDGETCAEDDFIGMLMKRPVEIRLELPKPLSISIPVSESVSFSAVMNDFLCGEDCGKSFFVTWADAASIVGESDIPLAVTAVGYEASEKDGVRIFSDGDRYVAFKQFGKRFAVIYTRKESEIAERVGTAMSIDAGAVLNSRISYYEKLPKCKDAKYEKLYYKALSVNKVNVYSPAGIIPVRYTTPDRVPHRYMWLWDSVFHSMAWVQYNADMAKDAIRAVLSQQKADGFIPHMMTYRGCSDITQPPVLAFGVRSVYNKCKDKEFLAECADKLARYLEWDLEHRDANKNYLTEWFIEEDANCRSGESGMDNSPRFDAALVLDAVDFSSFWANDAKNLSFIYAELGKKKEAEKWKALGDKVAKAVNDLLWCEADGMYYDRKLDGDFTYVASVASFIPLFAGIPNEKQAAALVENLTDENKFRTTVPIPSVAKNHADFGQDMWRGSIWLNYNYLIMCGLKKYGYAEFAEEIRKKTLDCVYRRYLETGTIFEFYDSEDKRSPFVLERKGECPKEPDWRVKVHSISDYNWSACFTLLMIWNIDVEQ